MVGSASRSVKFRTPYCVKRFTDRWYGKAPFTGIVGDAKTHPEFEDLIADRFIIGSPEECGAQITDLMRTTGCNRLVTRIQWVGMEHRYVMRTIELLGSEVAPLVRKALSNARR